MAQQSKAQHSKLVEQLEKEKQKIAQDVERLEHLRLRRGGSAPGTPRVTPLKLPPAPSGGAAGDTTSELRDSKAKTDLYRTALLVREANKIAQHLKKDLVSLATATHSCHFIVFSV